jgi:hypothetical protein
VSSLVYLLVGLIVVLPAFLLNQVLPTWLAAFIGLPLGAWLAWLTYQSLAEGSGGRG